MNKIIRAALSALSKYDSDLKDRYEQEREIERRTRPYYNKYSCNEMDRILFLPGREILTRCFSRDGKLAPLMIFFHGGGFVTGDFDSYNNVCANIAIKTGYKVVSVDYRLAPECRFPAGPEDCYAVTQEILTHGWDWYQAETDNITLIGDSAGANLCCAVSLMARDRGGRMPRRQILLYPTAFGDYREYRELEEWKYSEKTPFASLVENGTDYILTTKKIIDYMELYVAEEADYLNPYFALLRNESFAGLPETLLVTMEFDPLRDEGRELGRRMDADGCDVKTVMIKNGVHGMMSLPPSTPLTRQIYKHILNFLPKAAD